MLHQLAASNSLGIPQRTFPELGLLIRIIFFSGALERLGGGNPVFYGQKFPDSLLNQYHGTLVKEFAFVPADVSTFQPLVFETDPADTNEIPDWQTYSNVVLSAPFALE